MSPGSFFARNIRQAEQQPGAEESGQRVVGGWRNARIEIECLALAGKAN